MGATQVESRSLENYLPEEDGRDTRDAAAKGRRRLFSSKGLSAGSQPYLRIRGNPVKYPLGVQM